MGEVSILLRVRLDLWQKEGCNSIVKQLHSGCHEPVSENPVNLSYFKLQHGPKWAQTPQPNQATHPSGSTAEAQDHGILQSNCSKENSHKYWRYYKVKLVSKIVQ